MSVDICYLVTHGLSARMFLHSEVVPELCARGLRVGVLIPSGAAPSVASLAERYGIELFEAPEMDPVLRHRYGRWASYCSGDVRRTPSLWEWHLRKVASAHSLRKRLSVRAGLLVNAVAARPGPARRLVKAVERRALRDTGVAELLRRISPRLVVSPLPWALLEAVTLNEAQRAGIPTVGHVLSWDNVVTKGRFPIPPEYYISWGPSMTAEIQEWYGSPREAIAECGVPHFDIHVSGVSRERMEAVVEGLRLDPARPYLFFGMLMPVHSPQELEVVENVARAVREDRFGPGMQLVVRPHPQCLVPPYPAPEEWLARLAALPGPRVAVDMPRFAEGALHWNMDERDMVGLANLIAGASACINSGSTLTLEAVIHDKPVVLTLFDGSAQLPEDQSITRVMEYPHLAKLLRFGAAQVARSFNDLYRMLARYLADPGLDADARAAVRTALVAGGAGGASRRIAEALANRVAATRVDRVGMGAAAAHAQASELAESGA